MDIYNRRGPSRVHMEEEERIWSEVHKRITKAKTSRHMLSDGQRRRLRYTDPLDR